MFGFVVGWQEGHMILRKASNEDRKSEKGTKVRYLLPIVSGFYCVESVTVLLAFCLNRRPNPHTRCSVRKHFSVVSISSVRNEYFFHNLALPFTWLVEVTTIRQMDALDEPVPGAACTAHSSDVAALPIHA